MSAFTNADVKEDLRLFFQDPHHWAYRYGSPTPRCTPNSPYHKMQIEAIFEDRYFHWVTNRAVDELVRDGFLKLVKTDVAHFVYRSDVRYIRRELNRRYKIIKRYSDPVVTRAVGEYAEMLFSFVFQVNGFKIIGENTNEYRGVVWDRSKHDLDLIVEKDSITYGVEIKNTLSYMEEDEFAAKLEMCKYLGLVPLWILRNAPHIQFWRMKPQNGFILKFKAQVYPPGQEPLVRDIWENMRMPASVWKKVPEKSTWLLLNQHERRISK